MGNYGSNEYRINEFAKNKINEIKHMEHNNFKAERIISSEPDIRIGVVNPQENMQYGSQALKYNNMENVCRLINIDIKNNYDMESTKMIPISHTLCYNFEDDFKLCFKKTIDLNPINGCKSSTNTMTLENHKKNIQIDKPISPIILNNYKPLGWGKSSTQLDYINEFIKHN